MPRTSRETILDQNVVKHAHHDFTAILEGQTVREAMARLRAKPPGGPLFYLYVVDSQDRLVGVLPTRALIVNAPETPIASLMVRQVVTISASATVLDACEFFIQHRFLAIPVVAADGKLLGVVDVNLFSDEVFDLAEQTARDDVFQLIGIHVRHNQRIAPWSGFRDRFPWLVANMLGGTICALLAHYFEDLLATVVAVAMFVPIVLTLSESVSIQSMSIVLQGLHGSSVDWRFLARALAREFSVACLLGSVSGLIIAGVVWLWLGSIPVAVSLGISIAVALLAASLLGLLLPLLVRALRADPRIAAGPIVLATTDVITLLFYFAISARVFAR